MVTKAAQQRLKGGHVKRRVRKRRVRQGGALGDYIPSAATVASYIPGATSAYNAYQGAKSAYALYNDTIKPAYQLYNDLWQPPASSSQAGVKIPPPPPGGFPMSRDELAYNRNLRNRGAVSIPSSSSNFNSSSTAPSPSNYNSLSSVVSTLRKIKPISFIDNSLNVLGQRKRVRDYLISKGGIRSSLVSGADMAICAGFGRSKRLCITVRNPRAVNLRMLRTV